MASKLLVPLVVLVIAATTVEAQSVAPMRSSVLYQPTSSVAESAALSDSVTQKQRIVAAVGFAALGGLIGMIATADADGAPTGSLPVILLLAGAGAVAGYVTGGKSTD